MNKQRKDRTVFVSAIRSFMKMEHLTASILREFINLIDTGTDGTSTRCRDFLPPYEIGINKK